MVILFASLLFLILIPLVCADGYTEPLDPWLDVQGCKLVSEGGYFWMNFTNIKDFHVRVALNFPEELSNDFMFELEPQESHSVLLVAPWLEENEIYRELDIYIAQHNLDETEWNQNTEANFDVFVLSLERYDLKSLEIDKYILELENEGLKEELENAKYREGLLFDINKKANSENFILIILTLVMGTVAIGVIIGLWIALWKPSKGYDDKLAETIEANKKDDLVSYGEVEKEKTE